MSDAAEVLDAPLGPPPPGHRRIAWGVGSIGIWFALQIVLGIIIAIVFVAINGGHTDDLNDNNAFQIVSIVIAAAAGFAAFEISRRRIGWSVHDAGVRRTIGFWRSTGWVVVAIIAFSIVNGVWAQFVKPPDDTHVVLKTLKSHPAAITIVGLAFGASILAPLGEELLFRGLLFRTLASWRGNAVGAIVSSLVFGALHIGAAPWQVLPLLALLGFLFAMLYWRTGSIVPGMAMHALINSQSVGVTAGTTDGQKAAWAFGITGVAFVVITFITRPWRRAPMRRRDPSVLAPRIGYTDSDGDGRAVVERAPWQS